MCEMPRRNFETISSTVYRLLEVGDALKVFNEVDIFCRAGDIQRALWDAADKIAEELSAILKEEEKDNDV